MSEQAVGVARRAAGIDCARIAGGARKARDPDVSAVTLVDREFGEPLIDESHAARVALRRKVAALAQVDALLDQARQPAGDRLPITAATVLVDLIQFTQQMREAVLRVIGDDRPVRNPEVADQRPVEDLAEELLEGRRASTAVDQVTVDPLLRHAPPLGLAITLEALAIRLR